MLKCRRNRVNISRFDDDSLHIIAYHIACLSRGDLRQGAGGRLIGNFGTTLPLRRKDMDGALAEIALRIANKTYDANIIEPELLQIRLCFSTERLATGQFSLFRHHDARLGSRRSTECGVVLLRATSTNNRPTSCETDHSARSPDAGTRSNQGIFSLRHNSKADPETK